MSLSSLRFSSFPLSSAQTLLPFPPSQIQKVRTLRKDRTRPESRLSIADDFWERDSNGRHLSSNFTDDTSVDPNGSNPWGTFPSSSNGPVGGTPSSENVREAQDLLVAQKEAYEAKLSSLASSSSTSAEREDFEIEKNQMQRSIELISQEMKRLRHLRSSGTVKESSLEFEPTVYSAREIRLAKGVLRRWRALRTFGMAETVSSSRFLRERGAGTLTLVLLYLEGSHSRRQGQGGQRDQLQSREEG